MTRRVSLFGTAVLVALLIGAAAGAQVPAPDSIQPMPPERAIRRGTRPLHAEVFVGGEMERYLRVLQITGGAPLYPWSIRGFSPAELERIAPTDAVHPWSGRFDPEPPRSPGPEFSLIRPSAELAYNSAFPYGLNDGPVWAGRGATVSATLGVAMRWGVLSVAVAPQAFHAQNREFELHPNSGSGADAFADPLSGGIDRPQRFGSGTYSRLDAGESSVRIDLPYVAVGASTAAQHWGPATTHPVLLGSNAGGFPHLFIGTSMPLDLRVARVHGRIVWGDLAQSEYSRVAPEAGRRFMSGIIGVVEPPIRGLELGFARFYHTEWPDGGPGRDLFLLPLEAFLKENRKTDLGHEDESNQIASAFARWVHPDAGFELYGEFGREDHNWHFRDFLLEPDHISAYLLGFQKVWSPTPERRTVLRAELLNTQVSAMEQVRAQSRFYIHGLIRQGHTHRGQILGSAAGHGGGGGVVALDWYHPRGRWTVGTSRWIRNDRAPAPTPDTPPGPRGHDVMYSLDAGTLLFLRHVDVEARVSGVYNIDRDYRDDVFNLNASLGLTWSP